MNIDNTKYPTWQWIVWVLFGLIAFLGAREISYVDAHMEANRIVNERQQSEHQDVCDRVTRLESQYSFIAETLVEIKRNQSDLSKSMRK